MASNPVTICVQWGKPPCVEDGWPYWWNADIAYPEEFGFSVHLSDNGTAKGVSSMFQNKKPQPDMLCWTGHDASSGCDILGQINGIDREGHNLVVVFFANNPSIGWPRFAMSLKPSDDSDFHRFEANETHDWVFQGVKFHVKREEDESNGNKKFNLYMNWTE